MSMAIVKTAAVHLFVPQRGLFSSSSQGALRIASLLLLVSPSTTQVWCDHQHTLSQQDPTLVKDYPPSPLQSFLALTSSQVLSTSTCSTVVVRLAWPKQTSSITLDPLLRAFLQLQSLWTATDWPRSQILMSFQQVTPVDCL